LAQYRTNTPPDITYPYLLVRNRDFDKCHPRWNEQNSPYNICSTQEHPAISVGDGTRVEKYKCFLKGKFKGKELIVQPSFNLVTEGSDILKEKVLSPFLKQDLSNFEVFVVSDKVYEFGKIKDIK